MSSIPLSTPVRAGDGYPATRADIGPVGHASAVSWAAIIAGGVAAAAMSLILLILGTGLGLSSVSPFAGSGVNAGTFGIVAIIWLTFTQLAASGLGGYLAGRLRTRWASAHTDEVFFRDTAHGFLAWAIASLVTAAMLGSAVSSIVSGGAQAGAAVAGGAATTAAAAAAGGIGTMNRGESSDSSMGPGGMGYFVESMFRRDASSSATPSAPAPMAPASGDGGTSATAASPTAAASAMPSTASTSTSGSSTAGSASSTSMSEVGRIFANGMRGGSLPIDDSRYVAQLVSQRTGLPQAEAEKRVTDSFARMQAKAKEAEAAAKDAADKARKASAYTSLWLFVSLLAGAFVASLAATYGGRQRDL